MRTHDPELPGGWVYNWRGAPRPFVHPVTTPGGRVISVDAPADHPWHHGLWYTIKFVNDDNFWEEFGEFGLLVQEEPPEPGPRGSTSRLRWHRPAPGGTGSARGEVVLDQEVVMSSGGDATTSSMLWDITLVARTDVVLDRTPYTTWGGYGGLTFRGHGDWRDTSLGTAGVEETDALRGERSPWCRLEGPLEGRADGGERAGIAILDHPANPRHPTPWYASTRSETYGEGWSNFANAAFLWDGALALGAGERLRQRYLVLTWDGSLPRNHLEAAFDRWATT